jgi:hypothetical protein
VQRRVLSVGQDAGYCEECHTNTMQAAPVLAGLI